MTDVGGTLVFAATSSNEGYGLFRSRGTRGETAIIQLLGNITRHVFPVGGKLLFTAHEEGWGIWWSNGTSATRIKWLDNQWQDPIPVVSGEQFYVMASGELTGLWRVRVDGTLSTAALPGFRRAPQGAALGRRLVFTVTPREGGVEIWRTDGTEAGTFPLADLPAYPLSWTTVGDLAYFPSTTALWRSDATPDGTKVLLSGPTQSMAEVGGALDFTGRTGLWRSDGSPEGTTWVADLAGTGLWKAPERVASWSRLQTDSGRATEPQAARPRSGARDSSCPQPWSPADSCTSRRMTARPAPSCGPRDA